MDPKFRALRGGQKGTDCELYFIGMLRWVVAENKSYRKDLVSGRCREFDQFSLRTRYFGCRQQRMIQRQQCLLHAVAKLKKDMSKRNGTIKLFGCHFFLQIFLVDNLSLGLFTTKDDVLPRICKFEQATLRRMITVAADMGKPTVSYGCSLLRHANNVCYNRSKYMDLEEARPVTPLHGWQMTAITPSSVVTPLKRHVVLGLTCRHCQLLRRLT